MSKPSSGLAAPNAPRSRHLAIIAGSGDLPLQVGLQARRDGYEVFYVLIAGSARRDDFDGFEADTFRLGQLGRFLKSLRVRGIRDVVIIGAVLRPALGDLVPDLGLLRHYFAIRDAFKGGDDHLLGGIVRLLESQGLIVHAPSQFLTQLMATPGTLSAARPSRTALEEIPRGQAVLEALSSFDVGQAVVVADNRIVAVEGIEGTDQMLVRVAALRAAGRLKSSVKGVLVKLPKRGQDLRVDMPTVGPATIRYAAEAGLEGIAIAAGAVLLAERDQTVALADSKGLFLHAIDWP